MLPHETDQTPALDAPSVADIDPTDALPAVEPQRTAPASGQPAGLGLTDSGRLPGDCRRDAQQSPGRPRGLFPTRGTKGEIL